MMALVSEAPEPRVFGRQKSVILILNRSLVLENGGRLFHT